MKIGVVHSGIGNIHNVEKAVEKWGGGFVRVERPEHLEGVDRLLLPGVGAFQAGMSFLRSVRLDEGIREYVAKGGAILGICLGMQMLFDLSEEFGEHEGLGLIRGKVRRLPDDKYRRQANGQQVRLKIPHVGWDKVVYRKDLPHLGVKAGEEEFYYFTHSFAVYPDSEEVAIGAADSGYGPYCAVAQSDNVMGCQFHVELSSEAGIRLLRCFLKGA